MIKLMPCLIVLSWAVSVQAQPAVAVETQYHEALRALEAFETVLPLRERHEMNRVSWKQRFALNPRLREKYEQWRALLAERERWGKTAELKQELLALHPPEVRVNQAVVTEADRMSREIIRIMYHYRKEWGMLDSALLHNMFVNLKLKNGGFCWHWVEKFLGSLRPMGLKHFDLYWGVAYEESFRENNALVITRHGGDFDSGLAIDAWRSSGRPFWRLVRKDRFPWQQRDESDITIGEFDTAGTE